MRRKEEKAQSQHHALSKPDKKNRIPGNESLGTNEHTPACGKQMPFRLAWCHKMKHKRSFSKNSICSKLKQTGLAINLF